MKECNREVVQIMMEHKASDSFADVMAEAKVSMDRSLWMEFESQTLIDLLSDIKVKDVIDAAA